MRQRRLQQTFRVIELALGLHFLAREADQRSAQHGAGGILGGRKHSVRRAEMIVRIGVDACPRARIDVQLDAVAEQVQQSLLEDAQGGFEARAMLQRFERRVIGVEHAGDRVVPVREFQQQLVEVEAGHEAGRRHGALVGGAFRTGEHGRFALPAPRQHQQAKRLQFRGELRLRTTHTTRENRHAPGVAREHFENPAGVPVRVVMQDVARRELHPARRCAFIPARAV